MDKPAPRPSRAPSPASAVRGGRDLTQGAIGKTLLLFALPVAAANVLQQANALVNMIWVSHVLGEEALAALINANTLLAFLLGSISGLAMAANILVGQSVGAKDSEQAKRVAGSSTILFAALGVIIALLGAVFAPGILAAMGTPGEARSDAIAYLRVLFFAMPAMFFFSYLQMAQRGAGDARTPLYFSILAVALDIVLNPLLIIGVGPFPRLGVAGSALATLIAQWVSFALLVVFLYRRKNFLIPRLDEPRYLRPDPAIMRALVSKGAPMGLTAVVVTGAALAMLGLVNQYGAATTAAFGAANQLFVYVQMPGAAMGVAVTSMAAQSIGANNWDRVNQIARKAMPMGFWVTAIPVALLYLFNRQVMGIFLPPGEAFEIAQVVNHHALWGFVLFSISIQMTSLMRAAGAVLIPTLYVFASMWIVRIPLAAVTSHYFGVEALWWSFPFASVTVITCATIYYLHGGWRKARMLGKPGSAAKAAKA